MFKHILGSKIYSLLLLLLISGWIQLMGKTVDEFGRTSLSQWGISLLILTYSLSFVGILLNHAKGLEYLKQSRLFVLLLGGSCVSLLWSVDFYFTATRLIGVLGIAAIALLIATRFSVTEFLQWLLWFFLLLAIVNYSVIYLYPDISLSEQGNYASAWKGIFYQKNHLTQAMVFFIVISYIQLLTRKISLATFMFIVILAMPLVYFSRSMTAIVLLMGGFFMATLIAFYYKRQFSVHWIFLSLLVMIAGAYLFKGDLLVLVGKSETLTGRTITWSIVYEQAKMMPVLGHGYGTWVDYHLAPKQYEDLLSFGGHNGYLDIFFWFGWLGVFLFTVFIIDSAKKIYILLKNKSDYSSLIFLSVFFIMFVTANITESLILVRSGLTWTLFVIVVFKINELYAQYSSELRH